MYLSEINPYWFVIAASIIVILSYFFNFISKKSGVPSVLMLIALGIGIRYTTGIDHIDGSSPLLSVLGLVGLIMIVLEASLDLKLKKEKTGLIIKSFSVGFLALGLSSGLIALVLKTFLNTDWFTSFLYAIPLSIMSSAIIIPSVSDLSEEKKEFMIYESTFSDILGIMAFYFLLGSVKFETGREVALDIGLNLSITILLSVILSYLVIFVFQKIKTEVKLFLLISVLVLLYVVGKMLHLSSLIIILFFGLILNNQHIFFRGKIKKYMDDAELGKIFTNFKMITEETAFVVRTFFFVIFGLTISLSVLFNMDVLFISTILLVVLYGVRFLLLRLFLRKDFSLELSIAPRGLITILLFFAIPVEYQTPDFDQGILLMVIMISSLIMAFGLISFRKKRPEISDEEEGENLEKEEISLTESES